MAFKNLIAFGAGELTPELWERGNLDKFRTGLKRLRNSYVTKMGGLQGRGGCHFLFNPDGGDRNHFVHIEHVNVLIEFGRGYYVVKKGFDYKTNTFTSSVKHSGIGPLNYVDPMKIHYSIGEKDIYLFMGIFNRGLYKINYETETMSTFNYSPFDIADPVSFLPTYFHDYDIVPVNTPNGYPVDYIITVIYDDDVETFAHDYYLLTGYLPAASGQQNQIILQFELNVTDVLNVKEMRVYRRPSTGSDGAGSYGYIGSATFSSKMLIPPNAYMTAIFIDTGIAADFTNQPPDYVTDFLNDSIDTGPDPVNGPRPDTGLIYQDRVLFSGWHKKSKAFGTRTSEDLMTRDFPLQADSALSLPVGSEGGSIINRMLDGRGLVFFTSSGVFETPEGALTPDSAYVIKRSRNVHDKDIAPFMLSDVMFIYDLRQKAVITLRPSGSFSGYSQDEISIYSKHLLKDRKIVAWDVQQKDTNLVWMVLDNGTVLSLSYQDEQQVRSWAWHDTTAGKINDVFVMKLPDGEDVVCFQVEDSLGVNRVMRLTDKDVPFMDYIGSDMSKFYKTNMIPAGDKVNFMLNTDWETNITVKCTDDIFANTDGNGAVGTVFRIFRPDGFPIDLTVTAFVDDDEVTVDASAPLDTKYPAALTAAGITELFKTWNTFTGLGHLEGQKVSVRLDGFTHASPLNTDPDHEYHEYTVTGGEITLDDGIRGAIVSIGLPYVQDVGTLEIDTVEQKPTKQESVMASKMLLSYFESRGYYAAAEYPDDDTVTGMDEQERQAPLPADDGTGEVLAIAQRPYTKREEVIFSGNWDANGSVALRNVDPQPTGLRAILLDIEVLRGR